MRSSPGDAGSSTFRKRLLLGNYHPTTLTKRLLRPLVIHRRIMGSLILWLGNSSLELARKMHLRWRVLQSCQGVLADSLYWRGVSDAMDDPDKFRRLIASKDGDEPTDES